MNTKLDEINPKNSSEEKFKSPTLLDVKEEVETKVEEVKLDEFTDSALSIVPVFEDGYRLLALIEVRFNPKTGKTGEIKELSRDSREEIIDKFKNAVVERGFFG